MGQTPATPKIARLMRLAAAALGLGPGAGWQASERAALALRRAPAPTAPAELVTFLVPLVGPAHVSDFAAVEARLADTLNSFLAQSDPRWRAVICCQQRPAMPADDRLIYLPFSDPAPGNDKWRKLAALSARLDTLPPAPGYVMSFDADDLLHPGAVAEMLSDQAPGGYLVRSGYVLNHATGAVGRADAPSLTQPLRKPFWKLCGSCAALRADGGDHAATAFVAAMTQHEHRMFPYLARLAGRRLTPLARPSVLYVLNHGENFGARRGRVSFKARFVDRFRVTDPDELKALHRDFPAIAGPAD
ncbi:MAG: glycosyltransferase family 2 protein [Roseivivax sp.]|nr:glycosyltransferase family 2 protein [Roseivivax sp.]